MDADLEARWRLATSPFSGKTVYVDEFIPLADLRAALSIALTELSMRFGGESLLRADDWHEHDGYISEAEPSDWTELKALTTSDEAILRACTDETYVRRAYFTQSRGFLLRIYVPSPYDDPHLLHDDPALVRSGVFDVSCDASMAGELISTAKASGVADLRSTSAKEFFDQRYSG
jgi:hypothetical protein